LDSQNSASTQPTIPPQIKAKNYFLVPNGRLVNGFIGRKNVLERIETVFSSRSERGPHIVVLRGLGGQGKTQIALEYCRRVKSIQRVFWVDASSESTVKESFQTIARKIKTPDEAVSNDVLGFILDKFREWSEPWLVVFDNYDDATNFDNIRDYMPEGDEGCILITSRHTASDNLVDDLDNAIELPGLPENDALALL
jgi:Cdc6-like AAA superfamily ATPase